jgi:hypothetical protein
MSVQNTIENIYVWLLRKRNVRPWFKVSYIVYHLLSCSSKQDLIINFIFADTQRFTSFARNIPGI